jgi:hypothetical protein
MESLQRVRENRMPRSHSMGRSRRKLHPSHIRRRILLSQPRWSRSKTRASWVSHQTPCHGKMVRSTRDMRRASHQTPCHGRMIRKAWSTTRLQIRCSHQFLACQTPLRHRTEVRRVPGPTKGRRCLNCHRSLIRRPGPRCLGSVGRRTCILHCRRPFILQPQTSPGAQTTFTLHLIPICRPQRCSAHNAERRDTIGPLGNAHTLLGSTMSILVMQISAASTKPRPRALRDFDDTMLDPELREPAAGNLFLSQMPASPMTGGSGLQVPVQPAQVPQLVNSVHAAGYNPAESRDPTFDPGQYQYQYFDDFGEWSLNHE